LGGWGENYFVDYSVGEKITCSVLINNFYSNFAY